MGLTTLPPAPGPRGAGGADTEEEHTMHDVQPDDTNDSDRDEPLTAVAAPGREATDVVG